MPIKCRWLRNISVFTPTLTFIPQVIHICLLPETQALCKGCMMYLQFCIQEELLCSRPPRQQANLHSQAIFIHKYDTKLIKNKDNF